MIDARCLCDRRLIAGVGLVREVHSVSPVVLDDKYVFLRIRNSEAPVSKKAHGNTTPEKFVIVYSRMNPCAVVCFLQRRSGELKASGIGRYRQLNRSACNVLSDHGHSGYRYVIDQIRPARRATWPGVVLPMPGYVRQTGRTSPNGYLAERRNNSTSACGLVANNTPVRPCSSPWRSRRRRSRIKAFCIHTSVPQ